MAPNGCAKTGMGRYGPTQSDGKATRVDDCAGKRYRLWAAAAGVRWADTDRCGVSEGLGRVLRWLTHGNRRRRLAFACIFRGTWQPGATALNLRVDQPSPRGRGAGEKPGSRWDRDAGASRAGEEQGLRGGLFTIRPGNGRRDAGRVTAPHVVGFCARHGDRGAAPQRLHRPPRRSRTRRWKAVVTKGQRWICVSKSAAARETGPRIIMLAGYGWQGLGITVCIGAETSWQDPWGRSGWPASRPCSGLAGHGRGKGAGCNFLL